MKFVYFTDIHLCEGRDSEPGFKTCIEAMLAHEPEVLVNGGDLGITPAATSLYAELTRDIPVPIILSNGNHEMCSGYLPRERAGTLHSSADIGGVHFVALDVVRYFEPTEEHRWNWHVLADDYLLEWLSEDLAGVDRHTPLVVATHVPLSTTFPGRTGQLPGMDFPTNEIACGERILECLRPFVHVVTLHGHDHENCRHFVDHIEIMTTAAVAGNWWKNGLDSRCAHGREPQGYRVVEVGDDGSFSSRYTAFVPQRDEPAEVFYHAPSGRRFVNVFDASPKTRVEVEELGDLSMIDPQSESSKWLSTHLYELPAGFERRRIPVRIEFEDGRVYERVLEEAEL